MSKYIIENCPCYDYDYEECLNTFRDEYKKCYECTNCVLKQIVDILRENTCKPEECGMNKPDWNGEVYGCNAGFDDNVSDCSCALANNLLAKFDIQEVK